MYRNSLIIKINSGHYDQYRKTFYHHHIYIHLKNSLNNCVYADLKWSERGN